MTETNAEPLLHCCDLFRTGHYAEASVILEQWLAGWAERAGSNPAMTQQAASRSLAVALDCQQRQDWIALADELQFVLSPLLGADSPGRPG